MKRSIFLLIIIFLVLAGLPAYSQTGYVLNLYHFNLQYVAGSEKAMRNIVEKSFDPLLDFYLEHPGWGVDFELQAEFIEYLAENYPKVLEKFRKLAKTGQAEIISFHYSDQLVLAFPSLDQRHSLKLVKEIFEKYDLPLSGVVFLQEAQFGQGICALAKEFGYQVAVITPGQYNWFQDDPGIPYFSCQGLEVLKKENFNDPKTGLKAKWYFLGDGELVITGGINPYFSFLFKPNFFRKKKLEQDFKRLEKKGYKIATISEYLSALRSLGYQPRPLKPILDSPWRPEDDKGVFTWMGEYNSKWEEDYQLRTENWQTRSWLISAEKAGISWEKLKPAWKHQLNAEVSDSTGWHPLPVEINYGHSESRKVIEIVKNLCPDCAPEPLKFEYIPILPEEFPTKVSVIGAREKELKFFKVKDQPELFALEVKFTAGPDTKISFPFTGSEIIYSPALLEDQLVKIPLEQIKPRLHYLGLPNGLIGLKPGLWLIRDNRAGCVALGIDPEKEEVHFRVKKAGGKEFFFRFYILEGAEEEALKFANSLNQIFVE